jgi:hypothetical protein
MGSGNYDQQKSLRISHLEALVDDLKSHVANLEAESATESANQLTGKPQVSSVGVPEVHEDDYRKLSSAVRERDESMSLDFDVGFDPY